MIEPDRQRLRKLVEGCSISLGYRGISDLCRFSRAMPVKLRYKKKGDSVQCC